MNFGCISKMFLSWLELAGLAPDRPAPPARQNLVWEHIAIAGTRIRSDARIAPDFFLTTEAP